MFSFILLYLKLNIKICVLCYQGTLAKMLIFHQLQGSLFTQELLQYGKDCFPRYLECFLFSTVCFLFFQLRTDHTVTTINDFFLIRGRQKNLRRFLSRNTIGYDMHLCVFVHMDMRLCVQECMYNHLSNCFEPFGL